jgi:hypothetical protein
MSLPFNMPRTKTKTYLLLALMTLVAAAMIGCGSSGSSSQSSSNTKAAVAAPGKPFTGPKELTKFGKPGSPSDIQAASKVLAENLEAREKADFAGQCASLNASTQTEITGAKKSAERLGECPTKLEGMASPLSKTAGTRKDTFDGSIDELRVQGAKAWALYHGNDGKNYAIPLQREAGSWKVGSILTTEVN